MPVAQLEHVDDEVPPEVPEYFPAAQKRQDDALVEAAKVPAPQLVQALLLAEAYMPATHETH